ncbi:MAG: 3-phosphoglycerate dehydrogenase [Clostridiales bacterium]|nr:3-phosphoglycerate dehydrogenase [Clostridiales bacterium]
MLKVKLMNKIAKVGTDVLSPLKYELGTDLEKEDAVMVRSAALHDMEFSPNLRAIARCGAGVNNIPVERCTKEGIVVFNTPGANANAVKELAVAALVLASRDIIGGVKWAQTLAGQEGVAKAVEAGKSAFVGHELAGKTLGVIGLGAIGGMVANVAISLGMNVMGYDPYITAKAAWSLAPSVRQASDYNEIFKNCDYISLHVPATPQTKNMICEKSIAQMKEGVRILNLARADLVCAADIKKAIADKKVSAYITDFPTEETVGVEGIIAIPHLGASTVESEDHCAIMAAQQLDEFLTCGNIRNSVNFPTVGIPMSEKPRVCIMNENIPNMLTQITSAFSMENINIENMANGSKGEVAYTIVETNVKASEEIIAKLSAIQGVFGVRCFDGV